MNTKLTIKEGSENYACVVVRINSLFPIENADKIQRTVVLYNDVVVSKDVKVGDLMLYFTSGTRLNPTFCENNNLFDKAELNKDQNKKGFISSKSCRVKAIKLKGIISNGLLLPVSSLSEYDLKEGDTFTDIDGKNICKKYVVVHEVREKTDRRTISNTGKSKFNRIIDNQFQLHNNTSNLRYNIHKLNANDIIGIHYKKHGTSVVIGNVLTKRKLSFSERLLKKLGFNIKESVYDVVYSTRKVIRNKYINDKVTEGYYKEDIWGTVKDEVKHLIPKGWTLYGEIIGYTTSGKYIQGGYDYGCTILNEQDEKSYKIAWNNLTKSEKIEILTTYNKYDDSKYIHYIPSLDKIFDVVPQDLIDKLSKVTKPQHKFYVYKVSITNEDGLVTYLTDKQIEEWCEKVGLSYKDTFLYYGTIQQYCLNHEISLYDGTDFKDFIKHLEERFNEKDCYMCTNKVPEEGIIVRIEHLDHYEAYKLKSKRFLLNESNSQENNETNLEDDN